MLDPIYVLFHIGIAVWVVVELFMAQLKTRHRVLLGVLYLMVVFNFIWDVSITRILIAIFMLFGLGIAIVYRLDDLNQSVASRSKVANPPRSKPS